MDGVIDIVKSAKVEKGEMASPQADPQAAVGKYDARAMSAEVVQRLCKELGMYSVPSCNTILYLHQQNFNKIAGLEAYTECKVLHLENNCVTCVEGISHMRHLRVLYLQSNAISSLRGLQACQQLDTLNICGNPVKDLSGLPNSVRTLHAARTGIAGAGPMLQLVESCPHLQVLDLQQTGLNGEEELAAMRLLGEVRVLYLQQTGLWKLPNYRRRLICGLKELCYLDDRPVEDIERAGAMAWSTGGVEAERAARKAYRDAKRDQERRNVTSFALERAARQAVRESMRAAGLLEGDGRGVGGMLQRCTVATAAAVDALPAKMVSEDEAQADCAVCSDTFCCGDNATSLPCGHNFHSTCIRPWLLSFSNSCPLCRQEIGGGSYEAFAGAGRIDLVPMVSESLARRLSRPTSAPASRTARDASGDQQPNGLCAAVLAQRPAVPMAGQTTCSTVTATDYIRTQAMRDAQSSASQQILDSAMAVVETEGDDGAPAPVGADSEQQRIRLRINDMCRKSVGSLSREAESKLSAWRMMQQMRSSASKPNTSQGNDCAALPHEPKGGCETGGSTCQVLSPVAESLGDENKHSDKKASASFDSENADGAAGDGLPNVEQIPPARKQTPSSLGVEISEAEALQPGSTIQLLPPDRPPVPFTALLTPPAMDADRTSDDGIEEVALPIDENLSAADGASLTEPTMAWQQSPAEANEKQTETESANRKPPEGSVGGSIRDRRFQDDASRERHRVERMLRFYAERRRQEQQLQEERQRQELEQQRAATDPGGAHHAGEEACNSDDQDRDDGEDSPGGGVTDTGDDRLDPDDGDVEATLADSRGASGFLSLPAGRSAASSSDDVDLWDLGSSITVSAMPYM